MKPNTYTYLVLTWHKVKGVIHAVFIVTINVVQQSFSSYLQAVECHETAGLIFLQVSQQMCCFHSLMKNPAV